MPEQNQPIRVLTASGNYISNCTVKRKKQLLKRNAAFEINNYTIQLALSEPDKRRLRKEVLARDNYICYICNERLTPKSATIDHIVSRAKGGAEAAHNLACCCRECNADKGSMDLEDFLIFRKIKQSWQKINGSHGG